MMKIRGFPVVHIKGYIAVALLTAFVSWLVFSPDDDARRRGGREPASGSGDIHRSLPQEPEPLPTRERYGIAGTTAVPGEPNVGPYAADSSRQPRSPRQSYLPRETWPDSMEQFRFRPLTERERKRLEAQRPPLDYFPNGQTAAVPQWPYTQPQGMAPDPQSPFSPQRYDQSYSFRPEQRPAKNRHWTPYERDGSRQWQRSSEPTGPWHEPPSPQWGSTPPRWAPPADRMYPNLNIYSDTKLTAAISHRIVI